MELQDGKLLDYIEVNVLLPIENSTPIVNHTSIPKKSYIDRCLIHRRLMHISQDTIDSMCKNKILKDLPI